MNILKNKDGCCDICGENVPTLIFEPNRCGEYGGCDTEVEICLICFTKRLTEE